jgi:hypothetical protein
MMVVAEATPDSMIDPTSRFGAMAVLGAALLWLITKTIPKLTDDFRKTLDQICQRHEREREETNARMCDRLAEHETDSREDIGRLVTQIDRMLAHCGHCAGPHGDTETP